MSRMIENIIEFWKLNYIQDIRGIDIIEILIIAVFLYRVMIWIQNTKAWMLLRGILVIGVFIFLAIIFNMQTILYIAQISMNVLAMVAVVVFQPEIRRALENLGQKNILLNIITFDKKREGEKYSNKTIESILISCEEMSKTKTGALLVIENEVKLAEFIETGIEMDCKVSSQILLNIFEHNTPLHDGAVILRGDRIMASTCYLPLSENMKLNKKLGTRHRAAVGVSEVSDALVIIVSEETGNISTSIDGKIKTNVEMKELEKVLSERSSDVIETGNKNFLAKLKGGN